MQPGWADDYTVEDFGDVRIQYQGSFYRVIVGTGHNNVFACLNFLPILAKETSSEDALYRILEYSSGVIEFFLDSNVNDNVQEKRFVLPLVMKWLLSRDKIISMNKRSQTRRKMKLLISIFCSIDFSIYGQFPKHYHSSYLRIL